MNATIQVSHGGRVVIPAKVRQALHIQDGTRMQVTVKGQELRLVALDQALDALQEQAARLLKGAPSLAAELVSDRRAEAKNE